MRAREAQRIQNFEVMIVCGSWRRYIGTRCMRVQDGVGDPRVRACLSRPLFNVSRWFWLCWLPCFPVGLGGQLQHAKPPRPAAGCRMRTVALGKVPFMSKSRINIGCLSSSGSRKSSGPPNLIITAIITWRYTQGDSVYLDTAWQSRLPRPFVPEHGSGLEPGKRIATLQLCDSPNRIFETSPVHDTFTPRDKMVWD